MKPRDIDIPISLLERLFIFLPRQGRLIYRERPRDMFRSRALWLTWNQKHSGGDAAYPHSGYLRGNVGRRPVLAHRVVWALEYGAWPDDRIDHRSRDGTANYISNLRQATMPQQQQNKSLYKNNSSGMTGASWHKRYGKWQAYINIDYRRINLGYFDNPEKAHDAYLRAKKRLHPFQAAG